MVTPTSAVVWRKYNIDGVPASGPHSPDKDEVIAWAGSLESEVGNAQPALTSPTEVLSLDRDGTMAANSDTHIPSQKAAKTYIDGKSLTNVIRPEDYGAKGDGVVYDSGMAIASGSKNLTISGYTPTSADVGKYVAIDGAGAAGACLVSSVASISGSNLVLVASAGTTVTTAAGEIGTDDSAALKSLANNCAGKAIWFGAGKIYFRKDDVSNTKRMLFATGPFAIYGNFATVKSMADAVSATEGFIFADSTFTHSGPSSFSVRDLIYDGNRVRRISSGAISAVVYSEAGFTCYGCQYFEFRNCQVRNTTGDGWNVGGDNVTGRTSSFFGFYNCLAELVGRNGYSLVGAAYGSFTGCLAQNITFGAGHSNISTGWDFEPNGVSTSNANITCNQCIASNCTNVGFISQAGGGTNTGIAWGNCRAEACGIGFSTDNSAGTKVFAAGVAGNTTNFSGLSEKISGF